MVHYRPSSKMPFQWHFAGGPIVGFFYMFTGISNPTLLLKLFQLFLEAL